MGGDIKRHVFEPGAMSIIQMGEELIGHPSTAINELVKNGYDADATSCKVYFNSNSVPEKSFAIVFDNGSGMDDNTLFGDWLRPSVSSKRILGAKSAVYERSLLGSKGIGRLAAMALGEVITVISRKNVSDEFNWITVNRELFKKEELLSQVKFPGDKIQDFKDLFLKDELATERDRDLNTGLVKLIEEAKVGDFSKGTLIVIECLDPSVLKILSEDFGQTELLDQPEEPYKNTRFYKSLATLITPLKLNSEIQKELLAKDLIESEKIVSNERNEFKIEYGTNLIPDQDGIDWLPIDPIPIQSVFDYRIYGKVSEDGQVEGLMTFSRLDVDDYEESFIITGQEIKEDDEDDDGQQELFDSDEKPGEYYFDLRIYDIGEKDNLEKLAKKSRLKTGSEFRKVFKDFQGLRISKNGFGVKPYGEEVEDWIELSKARVQNPGQNVNTNQILGYVFFYSPENDNLEEKTNREGFLENKAFQQVKTTLKGIFRELGKRRYNYRLLHGLGRNPSSKHSRPDFEEFIKRLESFNASTRLIKYSEKFMKEVTTSMDNIEESLSFAERLASLGSGIELVYHEMAQPVSGLKTTKSSLELKENKIAQDVREMYVNDINSLGHISEVLTELRKSLQPAIGRTRKKNFVPYNTFLKVCNLYKSDLEEFNIKVIADSRLKSHQINDLEYAFWIAFLNIINNAVYWLKKSEDAGGEIRYYMENEGDIVISNTGPYINDDLIDHVFDYGVTTRKEKNATGLGLSFTQSVLSRNSWKISAENRNEGPAFIISKEAKD